MNYYEHNYQDISISEEDGSLIIINLRNGTISKLNSTGKIIWTNISNKSIDEIVDVISEKYEVEREEIKKDVQEYFDKLLHNQLIIKKQ